MRSLYKRISTNLLYLILGQIVFYILCLILVVFIHHSKDSKKRLSKAIVEVIESHKNEEYDLLDQKFSFLFDRNINNYSYLIKNNESENIHVLHVVENPIKDLSKEGFSFRLSSYKEWIFTNVKKQDGYIYAVQTRHEVDIIDDFMWCLVISLPLLIILNYKLCKKISFSVIDPLNKINKASNAVRKGTLSVRIPEDAIDKDVFLAIKNLNSCFDSLEKSFNKLNQFSVDVAHELKNPLASALASLQISLTKERDSSYYKNTVLSSIEDLKQIQKIVDSILLLHQDQTQLKKHFSSLNLSKLVEKLLAQYSKTLNEKKLKIISNIDNEIYADVNQDLIVIVLNNLLQNAFKFVDLSGTVEISLSSKQFFIRNSGEPIPHEMIGQVFDTFMKVEKSRATEGYGIGLSIVKWICDLHNFPVTIESNIEFGTTVAIQIKAC